ncbi:MAG: hypothetical protein AB1782_08580 [Cyanobacteriota bacterium]
MKNSNIVLGTVLMITILTSSTVFARTTDTLNTNLVNGKYQQQSSIKDVPSFKSNKFSMPGSDRMFNPQPEPPGKMLKKVKQISAYRINNNHLQVETIKKLDQTQLKKLQLDKNLKHTQQNKLSPSGSNKMIIINS